MATSTRLARSTGVIAALCTGATVLLAPTTSATAVGDPTHDLATGHATVGPKAYKTLRLGMSKRRAVATGLITDPQRIGRCTWYYLERSEGRQNPGDGVVVSPTRGVVNIPGTQRTHTPEGIRMGSVDNHRGSLVRRIEHEYPDYSVDKSGPTPIYTAPTPRNRSAHYTFAIGEDHRVKDFTLTRNRDGGCGLRQ